MKNNVAAGSDNRNGVGIWYLFPDVPVGPSKDLDLMEHREARGTPLGVNGLIAVNTHKTTLSIGILQQR